MKTSLVTTSFILFAVLFLLSSASSNMQNIFYKCAEMRRQLQTLDQNNDKKQIKINESRINNTKLANINETIYKMVEEIEGIPPRIQNVTQALEGGKGKNQNLEKELQKVQKMWEATLRNIDEIDNNQKKLKEILVSNSKLANIKDTISKVIEVIDELPAKIQNATQELEDGRAQKEELEKELEKVHKMWEATEKNIDEMYKNQKQKFKELEELSISNNKLANIADTISKLVEQIDGLPARIQKVTTAIRDGKVMNQNLEKELEKVQKMWEATQRNVHEINTVADNGL